MTLTLMGSQYWYILIWIFVGGGVLSYFFPKRQEIVLGKKEIRWRVLPSIILVVPYIIWAGYRSDYFGDTATYRNIFKNIPSSIAEISSYISEDTKDRGFSVLQIVFKALVSNSDVIFFLLVATFQMICIVLVYRKYSSSYWTSIFLFIASVDYLAWMHNGMRQFIAATAICACFGLIVKKKYVPAIAIILLVSTIHASALIMIPIIFIVQGKAWNRRTIFFIFCVGIAILFVDQFTDVLENLLADTQYSDMLTSEVWINDDGTNLIRVLIYSIPAILSLIGKKYVDEANDPVINVAVNASACTSIIYLLSAFSSGIYIGRLPIYTTLLGNYIVLPWLIDHIFTKDSARVVKAVMIVGYIGFFYYQMHYAWGLL